MTTPADPEDYQECHFDGALYGICTAHSRDFRSCFAEMAGRMALHTKALSARYAAGLEAGAKIVDKWDVENDPDDLYTGRGHLAAAIRAAARAPEPRGEGT